jgi:hypothetical protein
MQPTTLPEAATLYQALSAPGGDLSIQEKCIGQMQIECHFIKET